jgi:hypothetical protein
MLSLSFSLKGEGWQRKLCLCAGALATSGVRKTRAVECAGIVQSMQICGAVMRTSTLCSRG